MEEKHNNSQTNERTNAAINKQVKAQQQDATIDTKTAADGKIDKTSNNQPK